MTEQLLQLVPKWALPFLVAGVAWLAPVHALLGLVGLLIGIDFILGIVAAVKKGEAITSKAMSRTIYKALGYQLAVITGFALESLVPGGIPVAKLCASAIGLVEAKSIYESVQVLTGLNLKGILAKAAEAGRQAPPPPKE